MRRQFENQSSVLWVLGIVVLWAALVLWGASFSVRDMWLISEQQQKQQKIWPNQSSRSIKSGDIMAAGWKGDLLNWNFHNSEMPALNVYKVSAPHFWHLLETVHVQTRSQVLLRTVHIGTASESLSFNPCSNVVKFCLLQKHISEKSWNMDFGETQLMLLPLHCVPLQ